MGHHRVVYLWMQKSALEMQDPVIKKTMVMALVNFTILILWFLFLIQDNLKLLLGCFGGVFNTLKYSTATMPWVKYGFQEYKCIYRSGYISAVQILTGKFTLFLLHLKFT